MFLLGLSDYNLRLSVARLSSVGSHDSSFHGHSRSTRDSGKDVEAGGAVGVNQMPEFGGVGFARGFGLEEPEVY